MTPALAEEYATIAIDGGACRFREEKLPLPRDASIARATAIILAGHELGLLPMASLRMLSCISGRIVPGAEAFGALARSKGHRLEIEDRPDECEVRIVRKDEVNPYVFTFTLAMAKKAGLIRQGPWIEHPAAMLRARAITGAVRAACPDVSLGLYSDDEVEEIQTKEAGTALPASVVRMRILEARTIDELLAIKPLISALTGPERASAIALGVERKTAIEAKELAPEKEDTTKEEDIPS